MSIERRTHCVDLGMSKVDIPVLSISGQTGPRVVITSGVHGGEFVGIEAATRLADTLAGERVRGELVIAPVVNPPAVYDNRDDRSPLDGVNLNRVFPGNPDGGPTERLAAWLVANLIEGADAYVDLHSGGIDERSPISSATA
jgi:predicted deacylase